MRVILAGGGTGGHVIPALAIAHELRERYQAECLFVGTSRGIENRLVPAAGFPLRLIEVGALNRVSLATRLKTLFALPAAVLAGRRLLRKFHPDAVIGVGGYASGPVMMAAVLARVPTVVFEPNVVPGFANRVLARRVSAAAVHFDETCRWFHNCQTVGVPVRRAFFEISAAPSGVARVSAPTAPTLLLFGGSQGARVLNRTLPAAAPALLARIPGLRIVHQTGEREYDDVCAAYERAGVAAEVTRFIDDMPAAFARADLLVCRSGASTVAEVAAAGKPAVFIPFAAAADDHQTRNAEALAGRGAAVLIREADLTPERLAGAAASLLADPARLRQMGAAARALAHPEAAASIAQLAAQLATGKK
jgi:UDP-N-acetylglucosamine--N-acetylmuramyl-(pentapeptide) pyrophosphoryl-undecaprenol N-acetylglucosamine transferase